jgi:hypothetical protein
MKSACVYLIKRPFGALKFEKLPPSLKREAWDFQGKFKILFEAPEGRNMKSALADFMRGTRL